MKKKRKAKDAVSGCGEKRIFMLGSVTVDFEWSNAIHCQTELCAQSCRLRWLRRKLGDFQPFIASMHVSANRVMAIQLELANGLAR